MRNPVRICLANHSSPSTYSMYFCIILGVGVKAGLLALTVLIVDEVDDE